MEYRNDAFLFPLVREPASRWERAGLSPAHERLFNVVAWVLVAVFVAGWTYSIATTTRHGPLDDGPVASISDQLTRSPFSDDAPPEPAFVMDEVVQQFAGAFNEDDYRGQSGKVNVVVRSPGEPLDLPAAPAGAPGAQVVLKPAEGTQGAPVSGQQAPTSPGIWNVMLQMRDAVSPAAPVSVISLVPLSAKQNGRVGTYKVGEWPFEEGGAPKPQYDPPKGLVQVTPENEDLQISEHLRLRDIMTKGQENVWPKYVVLSPRLLDKVELTIAELQAEGHPVEHIFVISGFRTPSYNETGGDPTGRASLSRHMYGDAMDICVDNNHDGRMDDLNGDGRVTVADARVIGHAAEQVEAKYPNLIGGIGIYAPTGAHSGFVHIDTRGFRARW
ncbi:MAG TPA: hypothetical protein VFE05_13005 [Longimicrobiaceae bacterium]|jgi:uncharacterized protein YcbK (DUF882 family)|nr:hypothetical protein [Longimicrobiaceae bacterium]